MSNPVQDFLNKLLGNGAGDVLAGLGGAVAQNQIIKDIEGLGAEDFR